MLIRPATREDSRAIARHITMADSETLKYLFEDNDPGKAALAIEEYVLDPAPNRYSLSLNTVLEEDGAAAGSVIAFPADSQPSLDGRLLTALRAQGLDLKELTREGVPGTWYGSIVAVNPEYRGRGFGAALVRRAVMDGRDRGFAETSLIVEQAKPAARKLYERLGFRKLEEVRIADIVYDRMVVRADKLT